MKVVCAHCGLPFSVVRVAPDKPVYCCSGCALAARVPVNEKGEFPVNAALVTALGVGFVFFNQALFWMLAILLVRQGGEAAGINAARFTLASLATGVAVWLALAFFQTRFGARRIVDWVFLLLGLVGLAFAFLEKNPAPALIGNALFAAWAMRGLARKKVPGKK